MNIMPRRLRAFKLSHRTNPSFDILDSRCLLSISSASVHLYGRDLVINGTSNNDTVQLYQHGSLLDVNYFTSVNLRHGLLNSSVFNQNFDITRIDTIEVYGYGGNDTLRVFFTSATSPIVTLDGGTGNDYLDNMGSSNVTMIGGAGLNTFRSFGGITTADYSNSPTGVDVNLLLGTAQNGYFQTDKLVGISNVKGSNYNDILTGDNSDNILDGGSGNNTIYGMGGNDTLIGGSGTNYLDGGTGYDTYIGGSGTYTINDPVEPDGLGLVAGVNANFVRGQVAVLSPGDTTAESYSDIIQGHSGSCFFSAAVSAVERAGGKLASKIQWVTGTDDYLVPLYNVSMTTGAIPSTPIMEKVHFAGLAAKDVSTLLEMLPTPEGDFWTTLECLAYEQLYTKFTEHGGGDPAFAMEVLTGKASNPYDLAPTHGAADWNAIAIALSNGHAGVAGTVDTGTGKLDKKVLIASNGLITSHAYTLLSVDVPSSGANGSNVFVTVRNPWHEDTDATYIYDTNQNGTLNYPEEIGSLFKTYQDYSEDGFRSITAKYPTATYKDGSPPHHDGMTGAKKDIFGDGEIRITWATFAKFFVDYSIST